MSRQDFILIANAIKHAAVDASKNKTEAVRLSKLFAETFAAQLSQTNERFNAELFIQAATVEVLPGEILA